MSVLSSRVRRGRKSVLKQRDENIMKTLTYHDSDGELSPLDHDGDCSVNGSSPLSSPCVTNTERMEDISGEFLELDLPTPSCPSPKPVRRKFGRTKKLSPIPFALDEGDADDETERSFGPTRRPTPSPACSMSPPHRRMRALRLFDTPHTPKSLLQKARRRRLTDEKNKSGQFKEDKVEANFNPFTPNNNRPQTSVVFGKRNREQFERSLLEDSADEIEIDIPSTKKIALHEINTSRYNEEFHEICKLGDGEFGSVYKCVHRLDGCTYAIKKSKTPVAGSVYERNALNEVYAHAVLGKHQHVVRYYSAWAEDDYMYIQNEYCNGGSLADIIEENRKSESKMTEADFRQVLIQVLQGLKYVHSQNLVHLDIKPGNIFIHRNPKFLHSPESGLESCEEDDDGEEEAAQIYKIGDLGHVTSVTNPTVEDGDCRYLPKEILNDNYDHLTKADIFSLGLTMFEAASGEELPKNGELWHAVRRGELSEISHLSKELNGLLKSMIDPDPTARPSAISLLQHPTLCPQAKKSKAQLRKELNEERFKNQLLSKKLLEATQCFSQSSLQFNGFPSLQTARYATPFQSRPVAFPVPNQPTGFTSLIPSSKSSRLIGNKMKRSMSLSAF